MSDSGSGELSARAVTDVDDGCRGSGGPERADEGDDAALAPPPPRRRAERGRRPPPLPTLIIPSAATCTTLPPHPTRPSHTDSSDVYTSGSSDDARGAGAGGGGGRAALYGGLKTQLRWFPEQKAFAVAVRQQGQTRRGVEIKYKGFLHTGTGQFL